MEPMLCPTWFRGINVIFDIIFLFVTGFIATEAWRGYKFMRRKEYECHSIGFGLLSLAYLVLAVTNSVIMNGCPMESPWLLISFYGHAFLFLTGIVVLLFVYLKVEQPLVRAMLMLLSLAIVALAGVPSDMNHALIYFLLISVLFSFIVFKLADRYKKDHKGTTMFVLSGFALLTLGHLIMAFTAFTENIYVVAAITILIGYILISASRLMVKK